MAAPQRTPDTLHLPYALAAWDSPAFGAVLKRELEALGADSFPLQQGLSATSYALDERPTVMLISVADDAHFIRARLGVFFSGIIAGCSCADDPTPVEAQSEYCEMTLTLDKTSAQASLAIAPDPA